MMSLAWRSQFGLQRGHFDILYWTVSLLAGCGNTVETVDGGRAACAKGDTGAENARQEVRYFVFS